MILRTQFRAVPVLVVGVVLTRRKAESVSLGHGRRSASMPLLIGSIHFELVTNVPVNILLTVIWRVSTVRGKERN